MDARCHRDIPSANVVAIPATCLVRNDQPESISRHPDMRINAPDRGSVPLLQIHPVDCRHVVPVW